MEQCFLVKNSLEKFHHITWCSRLLDNAAASSNPKLNAAAVAWLILAMTLTADAVLVEFSVWCCCCSRLLCSSCWWCWLLPVVWCGAGWSVLGLPRADPFDKCPGALLLDAGLSNETGADWFSGDSDGLPPLTLEAILSFLLFQAPRFFPVQLINKALFSRFQLTEWFFFSFPFPRIWRRRKEWILKDLNP